MIPAEPILFHLSVGINDEFLEKTTSIVENLESTSSGMEPMGIVCCL
jgi:hypothetical protein